MLSHRMHILLSQSRRFSTGLFGFTGIRVPYDCILFAEVAILFCFSNRNAQKSCLKSDKNYFKKQNRIAIITK